MNESKSIYIYIYYFGILAKKFMNERMNAKIILYFNIIIIISVNF